MSPCLDSSAWLASSTAPFSILTLATPRSGASKVLGCLLSLSVSSATVCTWSPSQKVQPPSLTALTWMSPERPAPLARVLRVEPVRKLTVLASRAILPPFLPAAPWVEMLAVAVSSRLWPPDTETLAPLPSAIRAASSPDTVAESRPTMRTAPSARATACPTARPSVFTVPRNTASAMSLPPSMRAPLATTAAAPKMLTAPTALTRPLISTLPRSVPV